MQVSQATQGGYSRGMISRGVPNANLAPVVGDPASHVGVTGGIGPSRCGPGKPMSASATPIWRKPGPGERLFRAAVGQPGCRCARIATRRGRMPLTASASARSNLPIRSRWEKSNAPVHHLNMMKWPQMNTDQHGMNWGTHRPNAIPEKTPMVLAMASTMPGVLPGERCWASSIRPPDRIIESATAIPRRRSKARMERNARPANGHRNTDLAGGLSYREHDRDGIS